jgi:hypothetical protein
VKAKHDKLIRGKFRLGEHAFPSSRELRERIMQEVGRISQEADHWRARRAHAEARSRKLAEKLNNLQDDDC